MAMIQALPQHEIVTSNPWVDKPHKYVGPRLADVLAAVKANGKSITLTALNSFQIRINWDKVKQYDPILAWQDDGVTMRVRDKGPLWFILPLDQYPELKRSEFTDMMIWQLSGIDIQQRRPGPGPYSAFFIYPFCYSRVARCIAWCRYRMRPG